MRSRVSDVLELYAAGMRNEQIWQQLCHKPLTSWPVESPGA